MKTKLYLTLFVLVALMLSGCDGTLGTEPSASDNPTVEPTTEPGQTGDPEEVLIRDATVTSLEILILESFPVQVNVLITGELGDGCTELLPITSEREGDTFYVNVQTTRPAEAVCTLELRFFEETVSLDVRGLEAGTYTVDANGVTGTFSLAVDNEAPMFEETDGDVSALTAEDQAEIIRLTLERALIDQEIPDYQLIAEQENIILSTENIDASLVPTLPGIDLILLTPEEVQARANSEGDFPFLEFSQFSARSESEATVSFNSRWAVAEDSQMGYLSGGGFSIDYQKDGGGWTGEVTSAWIS